MTLHFLNDSETKEIKNQLKKQFGVTELPGILLRIGQDRIFLYKGALTQKEIKKIEYNRIGIERVGIYFVKWQNDELRLSVDGTHLLQDQINTNIFELSDELLDMWMHGSELNIRPEKKGVMIMKHNEDLLGTGKASAEKISNFIPKSRRLKFKN